MQRRQMADRLVPAVAFKCDLRCVCVSFIQNILFGGLTGRLSDRLDLCALDRPIDSIHVKINQS